MNTLEGFFLLTFCHIHAFLGVSNFKITVKWEILCGIFGVWRPLSSSWNLDKPFILHIIARGTSSIFYSVLALCSSWEANHGVWKE